MRGVVLSYDPHKSEGLISGNDEKRYRFSGNSVESDPNLLRGGVSVDFEARDGEATSIFVILEKRQNDMAVNFGEVGGKSRMVAGLLAIICGGFGIHKFYLGYNRAGLIMLLVTLVGFFLFGIPSAIVGLIAFVEGAIYIMKSDEDFYLTYVKNRKEWF